MFDMPKDSLVQNTNIYNNRNKHCKEHWTFYTILN